MKHKPGTIFDAAAKVLFESVEISDEDMKVINLVKKAFPTGSQIDPWRGQLIWSKSGGYAGEKSIKTTIPKIEKLGFKQTKSGTVGLPDGSTAGFRTFYLNKKLGWFVEVVMFYGSSSSSNSFKLILTKQDISGKRVDESISEAIDADGKSLRVGDAVEFKSDIEQVGIITKINGKILTLAPPKGRNFEGDYIRGARFTTETSDRVNKL
jgi:hypothetical protein